MLIGNCLHVIGSWELWVPLSCVICLGRFIGSNFDKMVFTLFFIIEKRSPVTWRNGIILTVYTLGTWFVEGSQFWVCGISFSVFVLILTWCLYPDILNPSREKLVLVGREVIPPFEQGFEYLFLCLLSFSWFCLHLELNFLLLEDFMHEYCIYFNKVFFMSLLLLLWLVSISWTFGHSCGKESLLNPLY